MLNIISTHATNVNFWVPYEEHGVIVYVGIQAHYILVRNCFSITHRVVNHTLVPTPIQNIAIIKRIVLHQRILFQFGIAG